MNFHIEEEISQNSTMFDSLFNNYYPSWTEQFNKYKKEIKEISKIIEKFEFNDGFFEPQKNELFNMFKSISLDKVKLVIWTDEPNVINKTNGIILKEMYKELKLKPQENQKFIDLSKEGILFMNASMCYSPRVKDLYKNVWMGFANIVIDIINDNVLNCIHLIWGTNCNKLESCITSREVYSTSSPLQPYFGFNGCNHFIKVNITLKRQKKDEINWVIHQ